jgi:hydroxylamine reductase (hybrid-cluster protein)
MWFITKNIIDYIVNTNLSKNKKADLINANQKRIKKEIKKLTSKQIIQYLFNSKTPNDLKRLIALEVNDLAQKKDDVSKEKVESLIKEFKKENCKKGKFICKYSIYI